MNKAELIDAMADGAGLSKADAKKALDAFVGATTGALKKGDRISLVGFGNTTVIEYLFLQALIEILLKFSINMSHFL